MADSYVCSGATMKCSMGTSQARLTVLPSRTVFLAGQPMANISDHLTMVNLAPFGRCRSLGFPATAAATAAAHGKLTPMPCMHNTPFPWMGGKNDYIVKGDPALLKSSTCQCMWGGTISITDDGQHGEGTTWVKKKDREQFNSNQETFGDYVYRNIVLSHASITLFNNEVSKATNDAVRKVSGVLRKCVNQILNKTKDVLADTSESLFTAITDVNDSAIDVVCAFGKSVLSDVTNLSFEITKALKDETLLEILKESTQGTNRNAASMLILNMYQGTISGGDAEVIQMLSKNLSSNKKGDLKELCTRYIADNPCLFQISKLYQAIESLRNLHTGDYTPDDLLAIPEILDYVVSRTGKEGYGLMNKLADIKGQLHDLPLEKYIEIKSFATNTAFLFKDSVYETGKEYLKSLHDSVGTLVGSISYKFKNQS